MDVAYNRGFPTVVVLLGFGKNSHTDFLHGFALQPPVGVWHMT